MSPKRTPEQEIAHQMQKFKDMGVTISTTRATGSDITPRVIDTIADAAKAAGIYYEQENK